VKVYIAGPMTGYPAYNAAAFRAAKADWEAEGWEALTPLDTDSLVWQRHYGRDFDPETDVCDYGSPLLGEMFAENVAAITRCGHVAMLPGWEKSNGATVEHRIATVLGYPIYNAETFVRLAPPTETILEEAQRLVHGNRGADYGHPIDDYTRTGRMWGALLGIGDIDPRTCCLMMASVKLSREVNKHKRDNLTDLAGYAECASMVAERQGL